MGEYHTVGNEMEPDVFVNGMHSQELLTTDDVKSGLGEMSPIRKLMFILSLALCGVTVIVFLFVLPCDWETCPVLTYHVKSQSWEKVISGIGKCIQMTIN
uniref:Uncharacterized protein n=1 Tax=Timema tahoe TaxID=61484 RepID=A0A7R9ITE5_9NEOP|nr:unnamed protein product [Timema tahoe]